MVDLKKPFKFRNGEKVRLKKSDIPRKTYIVIRSRRTLTEQNYCIIHEKDGAFDLTYYEDELEKVKTCRLNRKSR